jgi:dipeptidyl aminopeptidase/acylaminoacyl peptidase
VIAPADGSHPQEAFPAWLGAPVWSPTGDRFAYTSQKGAQLRVLDVATGTVTLLAEADRWGIMVIEFSPEGDRIRYSRWTEDEGCRPRPCTYVTSLWSINADGSNPRRLVAGTAFGDWQSLALDSRSAPRA